MSKTFATLSVIVSCLVTGAVATACYLGSPPGAGPGGTAEAGGGDDGGDGEGGCGAGPATLSAIEDGIFAKSCAFSSCHGGPTPAAGLDLTTGAACGALVNAPSCVFSGRTRVVPGDPDSSFLYHKVAGDDLGSTPDGTCAGLANGVSQRMPLGATPLCQGQIDQIKAWIAAGASCDDSGDGGAGADGASESGMTSDGGSDSSSGDGSVVAPGVMQLVPSGTELSPGQQVTVNVVLSGPAPQAGVTVTLSTPDPTILAVPSAVFVPGGQSTAMFIASGLRPGHDAIVGASGGQQASIDELVLGLYLAEVYYNDSDGQQWVRLFNATSAPLDLSLYSLGAGNASYAETTVQLQGTLAPSGCFVVGGPNSNFDNSDPVYSQTYHISPNIPMGGFGAAGVGVFSVPASGITAKTVPIDSVVYGQFNASNLMARDGSISPVSWPDTYAGDSLLRLGANWTEQYPPVPNSCGQ
jgi:hypothetical protein